MESGNVTNERLGSLMQAAQGGDARAYRELLELVAPRVRRVVLRVRGFASPEDREDLVQEVLLSLHSVRATYDPSRPFMPWLTAIVRNRLADGARRYARTGGREVLVDDWEVTFSDLAANYEAEELGDAQALREAVRNLPQGQRRAIELLKLEGLSLEEGARVLGSNVGALKVATHRAMAALRKALKSQRS